MSKWQLASVVGTNAFGTIGDARRYYQSYGMDSNEVARKVRDGEITIGKPQTLSNERAVLDTDGRWLIHIYREVYD